ncbi:HoxN/HupN/NixA family nickel/cobalt transporter [Flavobacterium agri]|nr:hypothetical protein [Flavobacterium agri]
MELPGLWLMLLLGIRHGFDPDHIAAIDGMSVRLADTKPNLAKWTGTLFAAGHGFVVTLVIVAIAVFSASWKLPGALVDFLEFVPGIILLGVGFSNLYALLKIDSYRPKGLKSMFLPAPLRRSSNPLAILATGALFAMVFDTTTQATALAYTATSGLGISYSFLLGFSFSAGMIFTDTIDCRVLYAIMRTAPGDRVVSDYRRKLGWIIACTALLVGGYKTVSSFFPWFVLAEDVLAGFGMAFFVLMFLFYSYLFMRTKSFKPNAD